MILALSHMDPVVMGILFLVAVVCFVLAALLAVERVNLIAVGLAFTVFVFMWQAFASS